MNDKVKNIITNYGDLITITTILSFICSFFYKLLYYILGVIYFKVYDIDINLLKNDENFLYLISISIFLMIIYIITLEIIKFISNNLFKNNKKNRDINKKSISKSLMELVIKGINEFKTNLSFIIGFIIFSITIFIILLISMYSSVTTNRTNYRVLENNKVIVYTTIDYYILSECEIYDNILVIYKGTQEKVSSNNIKSTSRKFNKVIIWEDKDNKICPI